MTTKDTAHPEQHWQATVASLVLGSDRAERPCSGSTRIDAMVAQAPPNEAWLTLVAAMSVYIRSGWRPAEVTDAPAPTSANGDKLCSAAAASTLERILHDGYGFLLESWCNAAAAAGQVAPPEYLPDLLNARKSKDAARFRDAISRVAGSRGQWLAQLNRTWRVGEPTGGDEKTWTTGSADERLAVLRAVRRNDPSHGRALIESTWAEDAPDDRTVFVAAMEIGLGPDDEAFLEKALDDKRKPVRQEAARLLSMMLDSAYAQRMAQRASAFVQLKGMMLSRTLAVTLPDAFDSAMARDGLEARKRGNLGEKAVMLSDTVATAPLSVWRDHDPHRWITAATKSDWSDALMRGWCVAAARQQHTDWAAALAEHLASLPAKEQAAWETELRTVLPVVNESKRSAIVGHILRQHGLSLARPWLETIDPWPTDLSRQVLQAGQEAFRQKTTGYDWVLRDWLKDVAGRRLSINLTGQIAQGWPTDADHWTANLDDMVSKIDQTLQLRRTIHTEFQR